MKFIFNPTRIKVALKDCFFVFLSASFLILSFPKTEYWFLAWVSFVPLFFSLENKSLGQIFRRFYLAGFLFFIGLVYWIQYVTWAGMMTLVAYLALYFGLFGLAVYFFQYYSALARIFILSGTWTMLEFIRANFLGGFDWGSLGYSQSRVPLLIQLADFGGVFLVSFCVMVVNLSAVAGMNVFRRRTSLKDFVPVLVGMAGLWTLIIGYGAVKLKQPVSSRTIKAAVIQGNIDQQLKWHEPAWPRLMRKHLTLTRDAMTEDLDLIIWPETSFPGYLWEDADSFKSIQDAVRKIGVPLLLGSILAEVEEEKYFNAAVQLDVTGEVDTIYRKIHLVPFGEYIPLRKVFPFLSSIAPIGDFTPGKEHTLFAVMPRSGGDTGYYSVLICFEDAVSGLAREFVRSGAQFLVNITNDAWFRDTKAPYLHLQSSIFRAVENHRPVVRSANTGVSAFIDSVGRLYGGVRDEKGNKTYVSGFAIQPVALETQMSFYTRYGDVFAYLCCLMTVVSLVGRFGWQNQTCFFKKRN